MNTAIMGGASYIATHGNATSNSVGHFGIEMVIGSLLGILISIFIAMFVIFILTKLSEKF